METLVLVMMILVCFSFVLKQTFHGVKEIMIISVLVAFFVGMTWPFAIEQSKTQIAAWIAEYRRGTHDAFLCASRRSEDFGTCEPPQMDVLHLPEVLPGFAGFPSAVQCSGDDHLPASRRIVPGGGMGACGSTAALDSGIHLRFEMAFAGATNPLGTALPGRGAARIDGHHRYGEWQDSRGRIQQFRCPLAFRRHRHRHRGNGYRMGLLSHQDATLIPKVIKAQAPT